MTTDQRPSSKASLPAGLTYRQFDYWCGLGLIPGQPERLGSGHRRKLTRDQIEHLRVMAQLVRAGFTPSAASEASVSIRATGSWRVGPFTVEQVAS
ncbi:MerR family transcriptional regulator [Luteipulveratus mongoliensis]|uniref:HTH merR-type domain-containing protein n=1 Tax=Luteipulveratus mongoliensis TaxID=571913 RepID=A0A0K1JGR1_9MICO|nr:MerR family transcriptional regulator [Luteipulveratus mongoliensis]AKU15768.1 hypothetical protein VV02_07720 [Luteipulveratus mongoliensis]